MLSAQSFFFAIFINKNLERLSGGSICIILFIVFVVVYLAAGIAYNAIKNGERLVFFSRNQSTCISQILSLQFSLRCRSKLIRIPDRSPPLLLFSSLLSTNRKLSDILHIIN